MILSWNCHPILVAPAFLDVQLPLSGGHNCKDARNFWTNGCLLGFEERPYMEDLKSLRIFRLPYSVLDVAVMAVLNLRRFYCSRSRKQIFLSGSFPGVGGNPLLFLVYGRPNMFRRPPLVHFQVRETKNASILFGDLHLTQCEDRECRSLDVFFLLYAYIYIYTFIHIAPSLLKLFLSRASVII